MNFDTQPTTKDMRSVFSILKADKSVYFAIQTKHNYVSVIV